MNDKESYDKFLLKEYDNIAQAHFNTKNSLIQFFRYYLLIIALPLPLFVVLAGRMPTTTGQAEMFSLLYRGQSLNCELILCYRLNWGIIGRC